MSMLHNDIYEDEDYEPIEGYCMSCREKVDIESPQAVWTSQGRPGTRGTCPICGGTVYRMGKTHLHNESERPDAIQVVDQSGISRKSRAAKIKIEAATYVVGVAEDDELIQRLADDLDKLGISTWADTGETREQVNWAGGVHPALDQCKKMVVVLSRAALNSEHVEQSWQYFRDQRKPVMVVLAENVEPPDDLRTRPRFSLHDDYKSAFRKLWSELSRI